LSADYCRARDPHRSFTVAGHASGNFVVKNSGFPCHYHIKNKKIEKITS
jgi:hypothetical protein